MLDYNFFKKWTPCPKLDSVYDIDNVCWNENGITLTLIPDNLDHSLRSNHKVILCWEDYLSYQITQESLRDDCWISDPQMAWSFYESSNSNQLCQLKKLSTLLPEDTKHFLIAGTNLIADVFSTEYPKIKIIPTERNV